MKTTLEISDELLIEAKSIAARRRTTLRALIEHALKRELHPLESVSDKGTDFMEVRSDGMPLLKRRGVRVSLEKIQKIMEDEGI